MKVKNKMYIDYKELNPCISCGLRPERLFQKNSGPIIGVECRCCWRGVHGSDWDEVRDKWNSINQRSPLMEACKDGIFHVHTYRCRHAGEENDEPGVYSFSDSKEVKNQTEYIGLCEAMIEGMKTGIFRVCAHPDRAFRRRKTWDEFWKLLKDITDSDENKKAFWIRVLDAHSVKELDYYKR